MLFLTLRCAGRWIKNLSGKKSATQTKLQRDKDHDSWQIIMPTGAREVLIKFLQYWSGQQLNVAESWKILSTWPAEQLTMLPLAYWSHHFKVIACCSCMQCCWRLGIKPCPCWTYSCKRNLLYCKVPPLGILQWCWVANNEYYGISAGLPTRRTCSWS